MNKNIINKLGLIYIKPKQLLNIAQIYFNPNGEYKYKKYVNYISINSSESYIFIIN